MSTGEDVSFSKILTEVFKHLEVTKTRLLEFCFEHFQLSFLVESNILHEPKKPSKSIDFPAFLQVQNCAVSQGPQGMEDYGDTWVMTNIWLSYPLVICYIAIETMAIDSYVSLLEGKSLESGYA